MKRVTTRYLTQAAIIAAIYAAVTSIFLHTSFGTVNGVQVRVSEALTLLPILTPAAIPGLFVGCLLANLIGLGFGVSFPIDVLAGPIVSLAAALMTRLFKNHPLLAAAPPVILNGIYVGWLLKFMGILPGFWAGAALTAAGQAIAVYVFGLILLWALRKLPEDVLLK